MTAHHADHARSSLNAIALRATLHCLTGCAIGEVLGMILGMSLGLSSGATIALAVTLAFLFGYSFTIIPLRRGGIPLGRALRLALAADTVSIGIMEIVDNALMMAIPGAMEASVMSIHFWGAMLVSLAVAGAAAYPVNRWLIARGRGHASVHAHHAPAAGAPEAHCGDGGHAHAHH